MADIPIMPDIPWEFSYYFNNNHYLIVIDNHSFVKRLFVSDVNATPLWNLKTLDLEHFNTHKRMYIDEFGFYYYLVAPFLDKHLVLSDAIKTMSPQDILRLFKTMLSDLEEAHKHELHPFDITPYNYLINPDNKPIFIDFDHSFYQGEPTSKDTKETFFDITYFGKDKNELTDSNIVLNDKILLLGILINSLCSTFYHYNTPTTLKDSLDQLKAKYNISKEVLDYLESIIIKKQIPSRDDYFIDTIINPLIDTSSTLTKK